MTSVIRGACWFVLVAVLIGVSACDGSIIVSDDDAASVDAVRRSDAVPGTPDGATRVDGAPGAPDGAPRVDGARADAPPDPQRQHLLLEADFETGPYPYDFSVPANNPYRMSVSGNPDIAAVTHPTCTGGHALRVPLDFVHSSVSYRTELTVGGAVGEFQMNQTYWFGFALYVPGQMDLRDDGGDTVFQIHGRPDSGEAARQPPLALRISGNNFGMSLRQDSRPITTVPLEVNEEVPLGPVVKDRWTTFVLQVQFSFVPHQGFVRVWQDGVQIANHTGGVGFNDTQGPYLKVGNYRPVWRIDRTWGYVNCFDQNGTMYRWWHTDHPGTHELPPNGDACISDRLHYLDDLRIGDAQATVADVKPLCR